MRVPLLAVLAAATLHGCGVQAGASSPAPSLPDEFHVPFSGTVADGEGAPLSDVSVFVDPALYDLPGDLTDVNGRYELTVPLDRADVAVHAFRHGYRETSVLVTVRPDVPVVVDLVVERCDGVADCPHLAPTPEPVVSDYELFYFQDIFERADPAGAISRAEALRIADRHGPLVEGESDAFLVIYDPDGAFEPDGDLIGRRIWLVRTEQDKWVLVDAATGSYLATRIDHSNYGR